MGELNIDKLVDIFRRNNVRRIALFGSFAREDAGPESDIDLLVTFTKRVGLLALVKLEREISEELDREIDLLTENSISPYLKDQILREQKVIYEEAG